MKNIIDYVSQHSTRMPPGTSIPQLIELFTIKQGVFPSTKSKPGDNIVNVPEEDSKVLKKFKDDPESASNFVWYIAGTNTSLTVGTVKGDSGEVTIILPEYSLLNPSKDPVLFVPNNIKISTKRETTLVVDISIFQGRITIEIISVIYDKNNVSDSLAEHVSRVSEIGVLIDTNYPTTMSARNAYGMAALETLFTYEDRLSKLYRFDSEGSLIII